MRVPTARRPRGSVAASSPTSRRGRAIQKVRRSTCGGSRAPAAHRSPGGRCWQGTRPCSRAAQNPAAGAAPGGGGRRLDKCPTRAEGRTAPEETDTARDRNTRRRVSSPDRSGLSGTVAHSGTRGHRLPPRGPSRQPPLRAPTRGRTDPETKGQRTVKKRTKADKASLRALDFDTQRDQPWRDRSPTGGQLAVLRRIESERERPFGGEMTRGRAADIILHWRTARGEGPVARERARAKAYRRRAA